MPTGRPTALTPEHVETARRICMAGGAMSTVANALGVNLSTVKLWMQRAREGRGSELDNAFLAAIQDARYKAEIRALQIVTGSEDPRDAQWWLTHNPSTRETWSDAAAERRAVQRTLTGVVAAIDAAGLTDDQRTRLLLTMQAQGVGVQVEAEGEQ
jgi:transposase-like protein